MALKGTVVKTFDVSINCVPYLFLSVLHPWFLSLAGNNFKGFT